MDENGIIPPVSQPLEEFRSEDAYVLLGDPGSGKTTTFRQECEALGDQAVFYPAHDFLILDVNRRHDLREKTIFIDGLDEIRAGAFDARGPLEDVRRRLVKLGNPRFRISCRNVDWLGKSDHDKLAFVSRNSGLKTLLLNPLTESDVHIILAQHPGIRDPDNFVEEAGARRLEGLLFNPISLQMLADVYGHGLAWPESRSEVFENGCRLMSRELNEEHFRGGKSLPEEDLLTAAGYLCAAQLITGAVGHSMGYSGTRDGYVSVLSSHHPIEPETLRQALSTRLFESDGEVSFVPVHRSVAEYLGARYLSQRISEGLPVGRILSLVTGEDGMVISALRGMSAWLTVHCPEYRCEIIRRDPVGTGLYGDVRGFSHAEKRELLTGLHREAQRHHDLAGLAQAFAPVISPDMEPVIIGVLNDTGRTRGDQVFTRFILDIMRHGTPQRSYLPILMDMVRDETRWPVVNDRALYALIHNSEDGADSVDRLWSLLGDVRGGEVADPNRQLLGILLNHMYPGELTPDRLWDYLIEDVSTLFSGTYRLFWYQRLLELSSDSGVCILLDSLSERQDELLPILRGMNMQGLPVKLLDRGLSHCDDSLDTDRLYGWLKVVTGVADVLNLPGAPEDLLSGYGLSGEVLERVRSWLAARPDTQKAMVLLGLLECDREHSPGCSTCEAVDLLCGSHPPSDFGIWCVDRAIELERAAPRIADHLLQYAALTLRQYPGSEYPTETELIDQVRQYPNLQSRLAGLLRPVTSRYTDRHEVERKKWADYVLSEARSLEQNRASPVLMHGLGRVYFGMFAGVAQDLTPEERVSYYLRDDGNLVRKALDALMGTIWREDAPDADEIIRVATESSMHHLSLPILAGMDLVKSMHPDKLSKLDDRQRRLALAVHFWTITPRNLEPSWYEEWLSAFPELVADVLVQCASAAISAGRGDFTRLYVLAHSESHSQVASLASLGLLRTFPVRCTTTQVESLDSLLWAALRFADRDALRELIREKLSMLSMDTAQRVRWLAVGLIVFPGTYGDNWAAFFEHGESRVRHLASFFGDLELVQHILYELQPSSLKLILKTVARSFRPPTIDSYSAHEIEGSQLVSALVNHLASLPGDDAKVVLFDLASDESLHLWRDIIAQYREEQMVINRDVNYRHPDIRQLMNTLSNRGPANAADLSMLALDRIRRIAVRARGSNANEWKQYWNEDGYGNPTEPKSENSCRDALLSSLRDLVPDDVEIHPEPEFVGNTRADLGIAYKDMLVPLEIKKSDSKDVWNAHRTQLMPKYTVDPATSGYGVYLVIWFGSSYSRTGPSGDRPLSAEGMQQLLVNQLTAEEERKISVFVLDVSDPR